MYVDIDVESKCILETKCNGFFLVLGIEVEVERKLLAEASGTEPEPPVKSVRRCKPELHITPVLFIKLTDRQARILEDNGVCLCKVREEETHHKARFKCVFFAGEDEAFAVFGVKERQNAAGLDVAEDLEYGDEGDDDEKIVLVRISVCKAIELVKKGARRCAVIRCPFID